MSFSKQFSRLKAKSKKWLGIGEGDVSRPASALSSRPGSVPPPASINVTSASPAPAQHDPVSSSSEPPTVVDSTPSKNSSTWAGVRAVLTTLESSAGAFPPLASAIRGLIACIDIFERSSKEHKEYEQLALRLKDILVDLSAHKLTSLPRGSQMTKSVERLYSDIKAEANNVKNMQDRTSGRQLVDAFVGLNDITECYRRIDDHLKRLMQWKHN
ncbi:hypothetical protein RSOLAG1IB_10606 [Rhizoctonia solani AG-1 IB]|uniref:Vegetative incompatibility protein HET-E-1 n=1 Tax=Thanatephorus cucumeris (strain AG1-IB / isolate 7/3/14) TaxID=1108050 RepID=A0A0B7FYC2_THACB|nr:hypothetical protein RSOLAG1IB_10606 [Rhizoctonia solani AG-1 IB]